MMDESVMLILPNTTTTTFTVISCNNMIKDQTGYISN